MKKILTETIELSKWHHNEAQSSIRELEKKRSKAIELLKELKGKYKGDVPIGRRRRLSDGSVIGLRARDDKDFKKKIRKLAKIARAKLRKQIGNMTKTIRRIKKEEEIDDYSDDSNVVKSKQGGKRRRLGISRRTRKHLLARRRYIIATGDKHFKATRGLVKRVRPSKVTKRKGRSRRIYYRKRKTRR